MTKAMRTPPRPSPEREATAHRLLSQARAVLLGFPRVNGVCVGLQRSGGDYTGDVAFVVTVDQKDDPKRSKLDARHRLPKELFGIPVDVQQVPLAHLLTDVAGGGDLRRAGKTASGHIGFMAQSASGELHALTAMHVLEGSLVEKPVHQGPYFDVEASMFLDPFTKIGQLAGGVFNSHADIAGVRLDAGVEADRRLLGTPVVLDRPKLDPGLGTTIQIAVPGVNRLVGHLSGKGLSKTFPTNTGFVAFHDLMHFRIDGQGTLPGWSGSVLFDPNDNAPVTLLSFGSEAVDAEGFGHVFGFPIAGFYESWGLQPL